MDLTSHILNFLSAAAMQLPSGLYFNVFITEPLLGKLHSNSSVSTFQSFIVLSSLPEIINFAQGLNLASFTQFSWPNRLETAFFSPMSQIFRVLSSELLSKSFPSHEKQTDRTAEVWPFNAILLSFCHKRIVLSSELEAIIVPNGEKQASVIDSE